MEIVFWWMPIAWVIVIGAVIVAVILQRRRQAADASALPVANTDRLTGLASYRRALARYRWLVTGLAAGIILLLIAAVGITTRFSTTTVTQTDLRNRDIVLCLDVSGSMVDYDDRVLDVFTDLADEFEGERLSMVIFNASAVTYFPLTSDYQYAKTQFARLQAEFATEEQGFYPGTGFGEGSSLVGDGLASCVTGFDSPQQERSRSVIVVTDNLIAGKPIFTTTEAAALAVDRNVLIYGINPGDAASKEYLDSLAVELRDAVLSTGGGYYALDDPSTIPSIVDAITAQQVAATRGPTRLEHRDQPELWIWLAFIALAGLFVVSWRVGR